MYEEGKNSIHYQYQESTGLLIQSKAYCGTDKEVVKKFYDFTSHGNPGKSSVSAKKGLSLTLDSLVTEYDYTSDGRYLKSQSGPLNTKTYYEYDTEHSLLTKQYLPNGNEVSYEYGPFRSRVKSISADNMQSISKVYWSSGHPDAPSGSLYYKWTNTSESTPVYSFYDNMGRQLRTVSTDYSGEKLYSDIEYDSVGRESRTSLPYYSSDSPLWSTVSYDNIGRVIEKNAPDGTKTEFDYNPLKVTTTISKGSKSQTTEKLFNKLGETIQSKDALNNVVYYDYNPDGTVSSIRTSTNPSDSIKFEYDEAGNRISIDDPDAGKILSSYDGFGRIVEEINAKGDTLTFEYDDLGRILKKTDDRGDVNYVYINDSSSVAFGMIDSIYMSGGSMSERNTYDDTYGRLIRTTNRIPGRTFTNEFTYDWYGRLMKKEYPSGIEIEYSYSDNGYLEEIIGGGGSIWAMSDVNELGQITSYSQGNYSTLVEYDNYGVLEEVTTGSVLNMKYGFDDIGNLSFREDVLASRKEVFDYDDLNRFTGIDYYLNGNRSYSGDLDLTYDDGGNITSKSDLAFKINYGETGHGNAGPHALTSIEGALSSYEQPPQTITYNCFNKVNTIQDTIGQNTTLTLSFTYGLNNNRVKTVLTNNSTIERVKYFFGDYEEDSTSNGIKKYHYINAPTGLVGIFVSEGSADTLYHVLTDHLGSLTGIINEDTDDVTYYSYDAWGNPRDPEAWTSEFEGELFAGRGYTGHEHLSDFDLINMNGRVYDPVLGRFLSPDPFVQFPGAVNGYNRYSYCLNNPLIYTDPSGYRPDLIFEEERRMSAGQDFGGGGGGSWNPFGWINQWGHSQGTESEWATNRINLYGAIRTMMNSSSGGYWDTSMDKPYLFNSFNISAISPAYGRIKQVGSIGGVNSAGEVYVKPKWDFEYWDDGQVSMAIEFSKNVWLSDSDHLPKLERLNPYHPDYKKYYRQWKRELRFRKEQTNWTGKVGWHKRGKYAVGIAASVTGYIGFEAAAGVYSTTFKLFSRTAYSTSIGMNILNITDLNFINSSVPQTAVDATNVILDVWYISNGDITSFPALITDFNSLSDGFVNNKNNR